MRDYIILHNNVGVISKASEDIDTEIIEKSTFWPTNVVSRHLSWNPRECPHKPYIAIESLADSIGLSLIFISFFVEIVSKSMQKISDLPARKQTLT